MLTSSSQFFLHFLTETMTHSSTNGHLMPRNRQYNSGPQMGLNNLFLIQASFLQLLEEYFRDQNFHMHIFFSQITELLRTY